MMSKVPLDLTDLDDADFETEIRPLLDALSADPSEKPARRFRALLLDRALLLLRAGSRAEIDDECFGLERFLASAEGEGLRVKAAEVFGGLSAVARLLAAAADRADPAAVDSILRNNKGRGQQVLELLAGHGAPVARAKIKKDLGFSESHLSHVLRELEEADLVVRYRPGQGKGVLVRLGLVGREVVERSVLPSWIRLVIERLADLRDGGRGFDAEAVAAELHEHGAPSRLAAKELALALAEVGAAGRQLERSNSEVAKSEEVNLGLLYRSKTEAHYPHLHGKRFLQGDRPASQFYGPN